jgi:hypothetical protein
MSLLRSAFSFVIKLAVLKVALEAKSPRFEAKIREVIFRLAPDQGGCVDFNLDGMIGCLGD